jgi:small subunit ribosomal protein S1
LTSTDPSSQSDPIDAAEGAVENQPTSTPLPADAGPESADAPTDAEAEARRQKILIGSQRDPAAYRARQRRDWAPVDEAAKQPRQRKRPKAGEGREMRGEGRGEGSSPILEGGSTEGSTLEEGSEFRVQGSGAASQQSPGPMPVPRGPSPLSSLPSPLSAAPNLVSAMAAALAKSETRLKRPTVRDKLSPEMEDELSRALGGASMDDLMGDAEKSSEPVFEPNSVQSGQVVAIRRDDVFVEFAGRQQGIVSVRLFDVPPRPGAVVQLVVQRLNPEDGLYELSLPNKSVQVDDWSDLVEGAMIDVRVTGHNAGGLECEVNHIRGFIPVSQIDLYRVEDLTPFVDQRLTCVITEADPDRRNLVLSRRAVLERQREEARQQLLATLQPGQVRDGVVRKLMDFGAFVDLGGIDGLVHVSQVAWGRVKHPSDVLKEGQQIKVRVEKVDPATGKISLAYRDLLESPWAAAAQKYPPQSVARGTVTKLMDFGAFVELEAGIEGLVHISELSHKRIWRCSDVVKEGQEVEVMVRSIDVESQRMSLSMKELTVPPEPVKKPEDESAPAKPSKKSNKPTGPLLGGIARKTGDRFGLKW